VLVVTDQSALRRAQEALERLNANLESRVHARTQALADANRGLRSEITRRPRVEQGRCVGTKFIEQVGEQFSLDGVEERIVGHVAGV